MTDETETPSPIDARLRVLMSLLEPPLTFARLLNVSLTDMNELVATGYFRMLKARGVSWQGMVRRMQRSRRAIANLAKRARSAEPVLQGSQRVQLRRKLVRVLAEGPAGLEELLQRVSKDDAETLPEELEALVAEGIVELEDREYRVSAAVLDLIGPGFDERLDSLRHFLEVVSQVVYRRFLSSGPESDESESSLAAAGLLLALGILPVDADLGIERLLA
ncbi:MAG: hypothetical protein AAGF12_41060 [Myxococcota bacterium]